MTDGMLATAMSRPDAAAFTRRALVIDCLSLYYILDEKYAERALAAGVNTANVTFGGEETWEQLMRSVELGLEKIEKGKLLMLVTSADDIARAKEAGRLGVIMGTQGASVIGEELWRVRMLSRLGFRILGLNGSFGNLYGDASSEPRNGGLTLLGRELVAAVNELPMLLDVAHCGHRTTQESLAMARAAVCSHANAYAVEPTDRNRKDEDIVALARKGGVIGICALPRAVKERNPSLDDMLDHIDHVRRLAGFDHVGLGLDLMEGYRENKTTSPGLIRRRTLRPDIFGTLEDFYNDNIPSRFTSITDLPGLTAGLFARGYHEDEAAAILGGNWLRCFRQFVG